ncbi:amidase [Spongiactinospora sp. 9N601]|uniref:amidase n=1 Tax=Spongiactinospora sp. 9N601 TaxID=3375149 RepID=UPI00379029F9
MTDRRAGAGPGRPASRTAPAPTTAAESVEAAISAATAHPDVFEVLLAGRARAAAALIDRAELTGPLAGELISVKANIDVAGVVTTGGSRALRAAPPATTDAVTLRALCAAGAIPLGHAAMTELAESAVGLGPGIANPHDARRVAGGSSTGDAAAVARGLVSLALVSDEGGSSRIPAAFCGVVGFRPSRGALSRDGLLPLSPTLDGPALIARDVATVRRAFDVLAGTPPSAPRHLTRPILALPRTYVWDGCDPHVQTSLDHLLKRLGEHFRLTEVDIPEFHHLPALREQGDFAAAETAAWARSAPLDRDLLGPLARDRLERGERLRACDYLTALRTRERLITSVDARTAGWDAVLMPTAPRLPPLFDDLSTESEKQINPHLLRTSRLANLLDRPAVTLPAPANRLVGLTLVGGRGADHRLLRLAAMVERALGSS